MIIMKIFIQNKNELWANALTQDMLFVNNLNLNKCIYIYKNKNILVLFLHIYTKNIIIKLVI